MSDALPWRDPDATDEWIALVLQRAHQTAEHLNKPSDARRAILRVAHSFADELATTNPQFDRVEFVRAATNGHAP